MRRPVVGLAALALSGVIVFVPRPWATETASSVDAEQRLLLGRVLAPTIEAAEIREHRSPRSIYKSGPLLFLACLLTGFAVAHGRRAFVAVQSFVPRLTAAAMALPDRRAPPLGSS